MTSRQHCNRQLLPAVGLLLLTLFLCRAHARPGVSTPLLDSGKVNDGFCVRMLFSVYFMSIVSGAGTLCQEWCVVVKGVQRDS